MFPHLPVLHDIECPESGYYGCRMTVPVDHPSVNGHFPGYPIIPGAVLLGWVWAAAEHCGLGVKPEVRSSRFLMPILPGDKIEITFLLQAGTVRAKIMKDLKAAAQFILVSSGGDENG